MTYVDYWNLHANPFDNVPDPNMYFSAHSTVESTVAELLFAIEEGNECLAAIVGEVGLGKTMVLRVVLDSLETEKYRIAFVTNPDLTFNQLLREIVGQLRGERCLIKTKEGLLEEFNKILFETADSQGKVLIFIDEGNSMRAANLEGLRLLTNMQEDDRNLMTLVLAGQPKLGRMLEDPRRKNFFQRIGIYARLKPLKSPKVIKDYVEHRLQCAGCKRTVFSGSAFEALFQHTNGVPRLVNRVCKLAMKAAETNSLTEISDDLIHAISERFQKSSKKVLSSAGSKGRKAVEPAKASVNGLPAQVAPRVKTANGRHISHQKPTKSPQPVPHPVSVESSLQPLETKQNEQKDQVKLPSACHLPDEVLERLRSLADEKARQRLAGRLAAKEITSHPEKYQGAHSDPVRIWDELRTEILRLSA